VPCGLLILLCVDQVKTSIFLTGPAVLYGRVLPYIFDVTMHEHYLITSTWKDEDEQTSQLQLAITLMSEIGTHYIK